MSRSLRRTAGIFFGVLLLTVSGAPVFAESGTLFVGYVAAQRTISRLEQENGLLQKEIDTLGDENEALELEIESWQGELEEISALIRNTRNNRKDLYVIKMRVVDPGMRRRARELHDRSARLLSELERAKDRRVEAIQAALQAIERNERNVTVNRHLVTINTKEIQNLSSVYEETADNGSYLDTLSENLDAYTQNSSPYVQSDM